MIVEAKEIQEEQTYNMNGNDSVSIVIHYPKTFVKICGIGLNIIKKRARMELNTCILKKNTIIIREHQCIAQKILFEIF